MKKKVIDIIGWYGKDNIGDEAFKIFFSKLFRKAAYDFRFIAPPQKPRENCDMVILGGGAVVSHYYLDCIPEGTPFMAVGVDCEWEKDRDLLGSRKPVLTIMRSNRDTLAYNISAQAKRYDTPPAIYCPDLVFITHEDRGEWKAKVSSEFLLTVFATDYIMPHRLRDMYYYGQRADQFADGLAKVLDKLSNRCDIQLAPFSTGSPGDDRRINMHIAAFMKHSPTIIAKKLDPYQMLGLIDQSTATLCQRFHAHVMSIIAYKPFTSMQFTTKAATLTEDYQLKAKRPLLAIGRKQDGFFNFDNTYHAISESLDAGKTRSEDETLRQYTLSCYLQVKTIEKLILDKI